MTVNRDRENLRRMIQEFGFGDFEDYFMSLARPSIRFYTEQVENEANIPLGQSKIGGRPDLPISMNWITVPHLNKQVSLPFIAQFNMQDIKMFDEENLLPDTGILYFFGDPWYTHIHADMGKVLYFDGSNTLLRRRDFPEDIPESIPYDCKERYNPCTLTFVPEVNLPSWLDNDSELKSKVETLGKTGFDLIDFIQAANYVEGISSINRLLGHNYTYEDMQLGCQLLLDTGKPSYYALPEQEAFAETRKHNWQHLFQMSSDNNACMMWSDMGDVCFFLERDALEKRQFERALLGFESG